VELSNNKQNKISSELISLVPLTLNPENFSPSIVAEWLNNPETNEHLSLKPPITKDNVKELVLGREKKHLHHWGIFVNEISFVGLVSCSACGPKGRYKDRKWVDVSIVIGKEYTGKRISKSALAGAIHYLFFESGFESLEYITAGFKKKNVTISNIIESLGFQKILPGDEILQDIPTKEEEIRMKLLKDEWIKNEWNSEKKRAKKVTPPLWEKNMNVNLRLKEK